jgi:hypothetical protein
MTQSAEDVTEELTPAFDRCIEVRVVAPQARVRYEKGQPVREAGPDFGRVIAAIFPVVEQGLQAVYGAGTEIRVVEGKAADVRLTGTFPVKAGEVRQRVSEVLADAFDGLELSD